MDKRVIKDCGCESVIGVTDKYCEKHDPFKALSNFFQNDPQCRAIVDGYREIAYAESFLLKSIKKEKP